MNDSLSDEELTFISNSKDSKLAWACVVFATAFNRLDASIIGSHLAEEVSFGSMVKMDEINGKAEVLDYITAKFETICKGGLPSRIRAELALDPLDNRPCVLVYQRRNKYEAGFGEPVAYVVLETDSSGLIPDIFFVAIDSESCQRTGIFPGLSAEQIVRDQDAPKLLLPPDAPLTLKLFVMSGSDLWATMERTVSSLCERHPNWRLDVVRVGLTPASEAEEAAYRIIGFPTLVIEYDGKECCRLLGFQGEEMIAEQIARLSGSGIERLDSEVL